MTTLSAESSPELSGSAKSWMQIVALYGVGPLIAVLAFVFLARDVKAIQRSILYDTRDTKAVIEQHVIATHNQIDATNKRLDRISRQLEAGCRVQAIIARNKAAEALCEASRDR